MIKVKLNVFYLMREKNITEDDHTKTEVLNYILSDDNCSEIDPNKYRDVSPGSLDTLMTTSNFIDTT